MSLSSKVRQAACSDENTVLAVAREKSREINRPEWTDRRKQDGLGPLDVQNSCINLHQLLLPEILASVLHMQQFGSMHGCTGPSMHWMILTDWPNNVDPLGPNGLPAPETPIIEPIIRKACALTLFVRMANNAAAMEIKAPPSAGESS